MKLSFGMIFSIILIIVFLAFAFYVIKLLIESQSKSEVLIFKEDLQNDIDRIWRGSGSLTQEYNLPKKIEMACFVDFSVSSKGKNQDLYRNLKKVYNEFENLIFYPIGSAQGLNAAEIKHINLEEITKTENPYCIDNLDGEVKLIIKRDYGEEGVFIER